MPDLIAKTVTVNVHPERAFALWVERIDAWWPKSHSVSRQPATNILMESGLGGRFYERAPDGTEHDLGAIVIYDPPKHLAYHWFLGSSAELPTIVDVRFTAAGAGTRVDVEHRGPSLVGELWEERQGAFASAWNSLLPEYVHYCNKNNEEDSR